MIDRVLCYLVIAISFSACESNNNSAGGKHTGSSNIERADVAILVDADANQIKLTWSENEFEDSEGYVVERQEGSNPNDASQTRGWIAQAKFPAGMDEYQFESIAVENTIFRVRALSSDKVLSTDKEKTEFRVPEYSNISIHVHQNEMAAVDPVKGEVILSTSSSQQLNSVSYFVDTILIGESDEPPKYPHVLNTEGLDNGSHRVDAKIEYEESSVLIIPRVIETFNTNLTVSTSVKSLVPNVEAVNFISSVSSRVPVTKVEYYFNGELVETLHAPNYCQPDRYSPDDSCENNLFFWSWKTEGESPQTANVSVLAYDETGETKRSNSSFILNRKPTLILSAPLNDELIGLDLHILGEAYDDEGVPQVEIKIGDITLLNDATNKIDIFHSMAGLPDGFYQVEIALTDISGQKTVESVGFYYSQDSYGELIQHWSNVSAVSEIRNGKVLFNPQDEKLVFSKVESSVVESFIISIPTTGPATIYDPILTELGDIVFGHFSGIFLSGFMLREERLINLRELALDQATIYGFVAWSTFDNPVSIRSRFGWIGGGGPGVGYPVIFDLNTLELTTFASPNEYGLWLSPLLVDNEDWFCQHFKVEGSIDGVSFSQEDFSVYDYQTASINRITNTSDLDERCFGITEQYIYYTSSPRGSNALSLYRLNRNSSEPALELDDSISYLSPRSIQSSENIVAWVNSAKALKVYSGEEIKFSSENVSSFKMYGETVVFVNDAIYVWKVGWQKEKKAWPLKDAYFLDKERLFVSRGKNPVLLYEINTSP